jgi:hypothetical protein
MAGTNISEWRSLVSPNAEGAGEPTIDKYVVRTLREFCEKTRLWQEALTAINIVSGTASYTLTHSAADICEVIHARVNGDDIAATNQEYLDLNDPEWRDETAAYPEHYYTDPITTKIYLVYTPALDITSGLLVYASLKPTLDATTVSDPLYEDWGEIITFGASAKLLRNSGMRKENIPMADYFERKFQQGIAVGKIRGVKGIASKSPLKRKNYFI